MKKHFKIFVLFTTALSFFFACDDDARLSVLKPVNFTSAPDISAGAVVITEDNKVETLLTVSWDAVVFPVEGPVTYTLQFDTPNDTSGVNGWAEVVTHEVGEDLFSTSFSGAELNEIALQLGLEPGQEGSIVIRIQGTMSRNIFSPARAVQVTPIDVPEIIDYPSLYIAGDFQGWNIAAPSKISSVNDDGVYEGYIYIPAGGTNEFKLYAQPDWEPTSYGYESEGKIMVANFAGANFVAPSDGYYLFMVNLNDMTYQLIKTSWGMIGAATPGGWDADTPLSYDPDTQTWNVTADMKADGSFKFRANNAWVVDFGLAAGRPAYANHPWLPYVEQPHFTVPSDGNYTITLDLHIPGNYTYKIRKN
ncbi:MAG TPA: SusE domain-containing protein [Ohtaekwangia sp.]|nr:SusE domain-containing protein [Ohtaekwangia sp.]